MRKDVVKRQQVHIPAPAAFSLRRRPLAEHEPETVPPIVHEILRSPGEPLDARTRSFFEPRFGHDFSRVRVHTDTKAAESARAVNALAYTVGNHVVFSSGQYQPKDHEGNRVLAHELVHVIQQNGISSVGCLKVGDAGSTAEREASSRAALLHQPPPAGDVQERAQQRMTSPLLMRAPLFTNSINICRRLLKSRVFHVSQGGLVVTANAGWEPTSEWQGAEPPSCGKKFYTMTLNQVGSVLDKEIASCEFHNDGQMTQTWTNLPEGDYYLTIWTNNTNPTCCLQGEIEVSEETGLTGPSCSGGTARSVDEMATSEKIMATLQYAIENKMLGEAGQRVKELLTPESLAMMGLFTSAYVVSQITPVGWVADILVGGLIAATVLMVGNEAVEVVKLLIDFFDTASNAKDQKDIETAAGLFAKAVTKVGIDVIVAILFHKAGKMADLKPPGPRSPGLVEVLKIGGGKVKTTILEPPTYADYVTEGGNVIRMPIEDIPSSAMMVEGRGAGGLPPKTGAGKGISAEVKSAEPKGQQPEMNLPGKKIVAASGLPKKSLPPPEKVPAAEREPGKAWKETGAQQERRLLKEDRALGRSANSATYHAYEGGNRGSFRSWFNSLHKHILKNFKDESMAAKLNEKPLGEKADAFIKRHPNLNAIWEKMNLAIDTKLKKIQEQKAAAAGDKVRISELELERIESAIGKRRAELVEFESGEVGNKRPDLVELFFTESRAVVTDITQRTGDAFHNFKTEFYIQVLKDILGWHDVNGVNFNNVYDQNVYP